MRINKGTYLIIIILLACTTGMAQMSAPFSMSPIATTGTIVSNGGTPIVMDGKGKCLNVSSGLSTLNINNSGKGVFGASCVETAPVAAVVSLTSLKVYPNPTHSTSILKCEGQFDANLFCQVRIMSIDGRVMMSQMVAMKDMQAGYTINASSYAAATYVVNVSFMNQNYNLKLIKL
jgi:hypothetical protein